MNILIVNDGVIPAVKYGGTERVMYSLGKALHDKGHNVRFLARRGSSCGFCDIIFLDPEKPVSAQIPEDTDVVHLNNSVPSGITKPYIVTIHGNDNGCLDMNNVYVSRNHAERHGSDSFVYNGLDWDDYGPADLNKKREHFHFLAKAAWRVKNVRGAVDIIDKAKGEKLIVLGGTRLNFKMGFRFTLSPNAKFMGMVGQEEKANVMSRSKGLIFPVVWHEPFGLAITESLYFGCPVFGTPYGSLPELVTGDYGALSDSCSALAGEIKKYRDYSPKMCHEYAVDEFNASVMAGRYLEKYEAVLNGRTLNRTKPVADEFEKRLPFLK